MNIMGDQSGHKTSVREEFTEQAKSYANSAVVTDSNKVEQLLRATDVPASARILEVATGPGHVARRFATACDTIVGVDITKAPLTIAEQRRQEGNIDNVHFGQSDAESLPFGRNTFDAVVSRLALHHLEMPEAAFQEMKRVCRPDGTVAIDDIVVSEHTERSQYQNQFERIRDPSHVRALPLSELIGLFTDCELEVSNVRMDSLTQTVDDWIDTAQTPDDRATKVRNMIKQDERNDLSGTNPYYQNGKLKFTQRTAIVVGKPVS